MSFEQYCQIVEGIRVRRVQSSNPRLVGLMPSAVVALHLRHDAASVQ